MIVKLNLILSGVLMLLCTSIQAQEAMYKWTNSAGIVQYSQFPPKGVADNKIEKVGGKKKTAGPRSLADIENSDDLDDSDEDEEVANADEDEQDEELALSGEEALAHAEKLAAKEKQRIKDEERKICEIATKNLIGLESRPIIRVKEGDDYRVLDKAEKAAKLTETRDQITKYCG